MHLRRSSPTSVGEPTARTRKQILDAENNLTPLEFQAARKALMHSAPGAEAAVQALHSSHLLVEEKPTSYQRKFIAPFITCFADPNIDQRDKALIVAFCGTANRLMIALSTFLQLVPSNNFDVVVLQDPTRNHYLGGMQGYAEDIPQLASRLMKDVESHRYKQVFCHGTSMGGFVALRFGMLLGGVRSISAGGRFPWHVGRLIRRPHRDVPAFEMLCACRTPLPSDNICVYGEESKPDSEAVAHLETMFAVTRCPIPGVADHNVIGEMWKRGTLKAFYREMFLFDLDA